MGKTSKPLSNTAEYKKQWRIDNKERLKSYWKTYYKKHPGRRAEFKRRQLYGIDDATFKLMLKAQDNKCAICREPFGKVHVDHDHTTGKVRALLCVPCNLGLGSFKDNIDSLMKATSYLILFKNMPDNIDLVIKTWDEPQNPYTS